MRCQTVRSSEAKLARLNSHIRAARHFQKFQIKHYGGSEFKGSIDRARSIFWVNDSHGEEILIGDCTDQPGPRRVFRCVPGSQIARCVLDLWTRKQPS
jgi:hypothetical protein